MKIPNSIRIAGVEYEVRYEPSVRDGGAVLFGRIDYERMQIILSEESNRNHQRYCLTLLHEVLHGIVEANGMQVEREEAVIEMFARGLYQVLQDNGARLFDLSNAETEVINASNKLDTTTEDAVHKTKDEETCLRLEALATELYHLSIINEGDENLAGRDACRDAAYIIEQLRTHSTLSLADVDLPSFRNLKVGT